MICMSHTSKENKTVPPKQDDKRQKLKHACYFMLSHKQDQC